jgi:hypothetical protein
LNPEKAREAVRKSTMKHPDHYASLTKKWSTEHREERRRSTREYQKRNPDKVRVNNNKQGRKQIMELRGSYIRRLLHHTGVEYEHITPSLINLKRQQIKLIRKIKELNTEERSLLDGKFIGLDN